MTPNILYCNMTLKIL